MIESISFTTSIPLVDDVLRKIVSNFEATFPKRVSSYVLIGSHVEGTGVPLSDIDAVVVFQSSFETVVEEGKAKQLCIRLANSSPIRLDVGVCSENGLNELQPMIRVVMRKGSQVFYGLDIRAKIQLPSMDEYILTLDKGARHFIARLRGESVLSQTNVQYPNPLDEFFGYTSKSIPVWYPDDVLSGTKELVATTSRIASAIVASRNGVYLSGKQDAISLYQKLVGGHWAAFVTDVYNYCKLEWQYNIPNGKRERQRLQRLCESMLDFENMYLQGHY